jgi:hypothetical protein
VPCPNRLGTRNREQRARTKATTLNFIRNTPVKSVGNNASESKSK